MKNVLLIFAAGMLFGCSAKTVDVGALTIVSIGQAQTGRMPGRNFECRYTPVNCEITLSFPKKYEGTVIGLYWTNSIPDDKILGPYEGFRIPINDLKAFTKQELLGAHNN